MEPVQNVSGTVVLPGSKSLSNRTLLLAALADGTTKIENLLVSQIVYQFFSVVAMESDLRKVVFMGSQTCEPCVEWSSVLCSSWFSL